MWAVRHLAPVNLVISEVLQAVGQNALSTLSVLTTRLVSDKSVAILALGLAARTLNATYSTTLRYVYVQKVLLAIPSVAATQNQLVRENCSVPTTFFPNCSIVFSGTTSEVRPM